MTTETLREAWKELRPWVNNLADSLDRTDIKRDDGVKASEVIRGRMREIDQALAAHPGEALREAFVAGAYWGMDNPFGPNTEIPQAEAERRYPRQPRPEGWETLAAEVLSEVHRLAHERPTKDILPIIHKMTEPWHVRQPAPSAPLKAEDIRYVHGPGNLDEVIGDRQPAPEPKEKP